MEKVCQICCTNTFRDLRLASADMGVPFVELSVCTNCGLIYSWPVQTQGQVGILTPTGALSYSYGMLPSAAAD
jgi:hypothetical protein